MSEGLGKECQGVPTAACSLELSGRGRASCVCKLDLLHSFFIHKQSWSLEQLLSAQIWRTQPCAGANADRTYVMTHAQQSSAVVRGLLSKADTFCMGSPHIWR